MDNKFLFTFVSNTKHGLSVDSNLFDDFDTALKRLNKECERLSIYEGTILVKKIGVRRLRATASIKSKHVDVYLKIAPLSKQEDGSIATYGFDYDSNDILLG